ncbi:MAG TPA: LTA synthase family protein [Gammaproteobacteria bacterium]
MALSLPRLPLPAAMSRLQKSLLFLLIATLLFSACRALLLARYPDQFAHLGLGQLLAAFANGLRFDGAVLARLLALPVLLMVLPLRWLDRRGWFDPLAWLVWFITVALVLLLVSDVLYFEHVRRHLSYELLLMSNDKMFIVDMALKAYLGALLLFVLSAVALGWLWWKILAIPLKPARRAPLKFIALFLAIAIAGRGGVTGKVIEIIDAYGTGDSAYGHLSLNGAFTTMVFALNVDQANHHFVTEEKAVAELAEQRPINDARFPMVSNFHDRKPTGYNIVFVLLESWNFQYVDSFGQRAYGATPQFDTLAADGLRFTNFYAAGQRSIEGIQATLTGIPALKGLPRIDAGIGVSNISRIGAIAARHGYDSIFVQSSDRDSFKVGGIASATGFKSFYGMQDFPQRLDYADPKAAIFGWDYETLMFLKDKLDGMTKPFIAYAFTGTTHEPYADMGPRFNIRPHDANGENGYLNTLYYADWSLGQVMAEARHSPWFAKTIFIFTADHANHFQEGEFPAPFHTPLLIYAPGLIAAGENTVIGSQLDVLPTFMDLLGFNDEYAALGESLLHKRGGGYAFTTMGGAAIALITPDGYLKHSLQNRLEANAFHPGVESAVFDRMEQRLLAMDQLSYELLQANRWAR